MQASQTGRPTAVTVICIIGFIGVALSVLLFLTPTLAQIGELYPWYPPYLAVSIVVGLISMVGMWMMKKWGVILYTVMFVVNQIVLLAGGLWSITALIIPLIVVAIGFTYFNRME